MNKTTRDLDIDNEEQLVQSHYRDELASFDGASWSEASGREDFEIDGHACIYWGEVQPSKGKERVSVTTVELGSLRLIYQV